MYNEWAMKKTAINPNDVKTRDWALVRLINGATKGGAHKDRKKDANKRECRKKVRTEDA